MVVVVIAGMIIVLHLVWVMVVIAERIIVLDLVWVEVVIVGRITRCSWLRFGGW